MSVNLPEEAASAVTWRRGQRRPLLSPEEQMELVEVARREGFEGTAYAYLREDLWGYALPTIKKHLRNGAIRALLRERGVDIAIRPEDLEALHTSVSERDALTVDTLLRADRYFRKKAMGPDGWNPQK